MSLVAKRTIGGRQALLGSSTNTAAGTKRALGSGLHLPPFSGIVLSLAYAVNSD